MKKIIVNNTNVSKEALSWLLNTRTIRSVEDSHYSGECGNISIETTAYPYDTNEDIKAIKTRHKDCLFVAKSFSDIEVKAVGCFPSVIIVYSQGDCEGP